MIEGIIEVIGYFVAAIIECFIMSVCGVLGAAFVFGLTLGKVRWHNEESQAILVGVVLAAAGIAGFVWFGLHHSAAAPGAAA